MNKPKIIASAVALFAVIFLAVFVVRSLRARDARIEKVYRIHCLNNLREFGKALLSHEDPVTGQNDWPR